jgi:parallel beta-helix repeat protein
MRYLLTILFLCSKAFATNYYVANAGNDSNSGTSSSPFATLLKANSVAVSGDSVFLNRGDSWNEKLIPLASNIYYGAYGTGSKPLITGFQTLTGFANTSGNIWTVTASNSVKNLNTVLFNELLQAKGRYPNATATNGGYLTYQSATQTSLTSSSLTGTPNYTGVEVVVRTAAWILDVVKVSSQSGSTLNFPALTYNAGSLGGNGFFLQNDSSLLDVQGEWSYDSVSKRFQIYSPTNPSGNVKISTIDTLIYVNAHSYITFDNLSIVGANKSAFQFDTLSNIIVQNCSINYSGTLALSAQKCSYLSAINDSIQNSLSGAIYWRRVDPYTPMQDTCNYATVSGCYIKNTAVFAGMGLNSNGRYVGINVVGYKPTITNNKIDSTGFNAIFFNGDSSLLKNNYISNFCFLKDDGGGIVTVIGAYVPSTYNVGSVVKSNIIINGAGQPYGNTWVNTSSGIYLDQSTNNVTLDSNTIYNCNYNAMSIGQADYNTITNNTIYNGIGNGISIHGDNTEISASGNQINNNAVYISSSSWQIMYRYTGTNVGLIDYNFYSRPSNENSAFYLSGNNSTLYGWRAATLKDIHSKGTPSGLLSNTPIFVYNPTLHDSTIYFSGRKISLRGVTYAGSITLHPFQSAILFEAILPQQYPYKYYR